MTVSLGVYESCYGFFLAERVCGNWKEIQMKKETKEMKKRRIGSDVRFGWYSIAV